MAPDNATGSDVRAVVWRYQHPGRKRPAGKRKTMSKKLYIGNLPYSVTETALREMFTPLGVVDSVSIITDRDTGRPKGFAFVEMTDDDAAKQAISQINGKTLDNRSITVAEARPQVQRSGGAGSSGGWSRR
jgi:RNA recognition motif-containing protein